MKCEICGKEFRFYTQLKRHVENEHCITAVDYWRTYIIKNKDAGNCPICGKLLNMNRFHMLRGFNVKVHSGKCNAITKENYIKIYGEDEGLKRWEHYCSLQSETNTFEYKQKKYGWTKEQFDEYNKSRAVTLENMINKYGKEEGEKKFRNYCEIQKTVGCALEYFIEKYGPEEGEKKFKEVNKSKAQSLENFIKRFGEEDGKRKFDDYITNNFKAYTSILATEFFKELTPIKGDNIYYGDREFGKGQRINGKWEYYKYDYTDTKTMKMIEFNGDYFHPKSRFDENWIPAAHRGVIAADAYDHDMRKKKCAEDNGFKIFYIWEHEVMENREDAIKRCLAFLEK